MDDKPTYDELEQKAEELEDEVAKLKKLKKHWQILSSAIGDSSEGIAIIDLDGNLNYLNNTFAELHGYSVNDLLGKHFSIFHTPQQMQSVKDANRQVKEKGTFIGEIWHTRRDGTVFPTIMHNSLIRDEEGKPTYWLGTIRDISEQKKLEADLLESGNKYKLLFEGSLSPIIVFDRDGVVLVINSEGARNLGLPIEACIGKPITELLPDLDEVYSSIFKQVIDTGAKMTREDLVELPLGPRWFWSILEPVSNIHGKRYGVQVISYDITKRKQAENELKESEERFRAITNTAMDSIFCKDINRHYTFVNSSMVQLMGCTEVELVGKVPEEVFNKEDAAIVNEVDQRTLSGENVNEVRSLTIAGKPYTFHTIQVPLRDSDGNIKGISGIVRDITELKQAEEDLRKERDKSQHYLDIAGVILVAIDTEQNVMMINKKGCEILGYEEHEIVGKKWFNHFIKAEEAEEIKRVFNQIISGKIEVDEYYENAILTKCRGERILAWHNSLIRDESGRIIGTLSSGEDITDRKRAEEALSKTNERLEKKVKERTVELKERNTTLKVLLDQRKNDKERMEKTIMLNIKKLINPNLARLKKISLNDRQKSELGILEANLYEIISPFESSLTSEYLKLTPTEMQVANFIKHNTTSREIASLLGLSRRTIDTHRHNIRKKIGIRGKGVNLKTYLSSLT